MSGQSLDPDCVEALLRHQAEIAAIAVEFRDVGEATERAQ
jgi:response regulator RpfG family c-di-GMP phosphodiesterase